MELHYQTTPPTTDVAVIVASLLSAAAAAAPSGLEFTRALSMIRLFALALTSVIGVTAVGIERAMPATSMSVRDPQWTRINSMGLGIDFPAAVFTVDAGPSDKGPGHRYVSQDGSAGLCIGLNQIQTMRVRPCS